jgi:hypothetical protein
MVAGAVYVAPAFGLDIDTVGGVFAARRRADGHVTELCCDQGRRVAARDREADVDGGRHRNGVRTHKSPLTAIGRQVGAEHVAFTHEPAPTGESRRR